MAVKTVSTFTLPDEYQRQASEARRRRRMAEMLAQQAYQPGDIQSAPIPRGAPLVQGLQAFLAARAARKADEAEESAEEKASQIGSQIAGRLTGREIVPAAPVDAFGLQEFQSAAPAFAQDMQRRNAEEQAQLKAGDIQEVTRQSQYVYDPQDAMRLAMTRGGNAAIRGNPMLATMLARSMETPKEAEYGTTPQFDKEGRAFVVNKAGNVRFLDNVKAPEKTTSLQDDFKFAQKKGYKGSFEQFRQSNRPQTNVYSTTAVAGVDDKGNPVFFQTSPTGGSPMVVPGVKPKPEAPGAEESKSALFADRMSESAPLLDILPPPSITASAKSKTPFVGNVLTSPKNKQFNQAAINFISAVLRKESGANIPDSEIESQARIYIPMAGDDPVTLEQKRRARESAIRGLSLSAGPSYKPVPINPPKGVTPQEWAVMTLDERRKFAQ